jgi:hypothetical protein
MLAGQLQIVQRHVQRGLHTAGNCRCRGKCAAAGQEVPAGMLAQDGITVKCSGDEQAWLDSCV